MSYNLHIFCCYIGSHRRDGHRGTLVHLLPMRTHGNHLGCQSIGGRQHGREFRTCWQISHCKSSARDKLPQPKHTNSTQHNDGKGLPATSTLP